jgi:hypothetical protein
MDPIRNILILFVFVNVITCGSVVVVFQIHRECESLC